MQVPHPVNFRFSDNISEFIRLQALSSDVCCVQLDFPDLLPHEGAAAIQPLTEHKARFDFKIVGHNGFRIIDAQQQVILQSDSQGWIGRSGSAWVMRWKHHEGMRFYGLGGKSGALDRKGMQTSCWNVDAWGVHPLEAIRHDTVDPLYANIPWLIVDNGIAENGGAVGIFVHHPGAVFFSLKEDVRLHPSQEAVTQYLPSFFMGAPEGHPEIYLIAGSCVKEVAQRFSQFIGTMSRPPLWALGHHQCRWGYGSAADLKYLHDHFTQYQIPCDGLWLDIDYMDGYRVFTLSQENQLDLKDTLQELKAKGRQCVAILNPGVKDETGYSVRDEGIAKGVFCRNEEGDFFKGFVWPGITLYPDFSMEKVRQWWADYVAEFVRHGFSGFWLDMNDPSTGQVDPRSMRFCQGSLAHWTWHNQYANGMAQATFAGLIQANPKQRPFLISRSGWAGIGSYSGLWMGDNFSNWLHLRQSIPMALNLAMSGVALVGADVPGFGDNANPELMERWYQAHVLFPFLRNHCVKNAIAQEPWVFGPETTAVVKRAIQERYRLLPYLYQCFIAHEQTGDLVMNPMHHHQGHMLEDQYFVGNQVFVAPVLNEKCKEREVYFPPGAWFNIDLSTWFEGPATIMVTMPRDSLAIFFKEGSVIPTVANPVLISTQEIDFTSIEYQLFLRPNCTINDIDTKQCEGSMQWDDGYSIPVTPICQASWRLVQGATGVQVQGLCPTKSRFRILGQ